MEVHEGHEDSASNAPSQLEGHEEGYGEPITDKAPVGEVDESEDLDEDSKELVDSMEDSLMEENLNSTTWTLMMLRSLQVAQFQKTLSLELLKALLKVKESAENARSKASTGDTQSNFQNKMESGPPTIPTSYELYYTSTNNAMEQPLRSPAFLKAMTFKASTT